jgi:hypothetical protein
MLPRGIFASFPSLIPGVSEFWFSMLTTGSVFGGAIAESRHKPISGGGGRVIALGAGEPAIAVGKVGGNRERAAVELADKETVSPRELPGLAAEFVGEIDGLPAGDEVLEGERHEPERRFRESKVESRPRRGEQAAFERFFRRSALYFLPSPLYSPLANRGDRTPSGLFDEGVRAMPPAVTAAIKGFVENVGNTLKLVEYEE